MQRLFFIDEGKVYAKTMNFPAPVEDRCFPLEFSRLGRQAG
jgi:hypothetical protein